MQTQQVQHIQPVQPVQSSKKTAAVVLGAALLVLASPMAATAAATAGSAAHSAPHHPYTRATLQQDLAAVRAAGGGDVNVLARVDGSRTAPLMARIGTRTADSPAPIPWNSHFRVASTTKTFTATVVLQLVAEKRLSLDDTVEHWLPGVVSGNGNDGRRITVRDLLRQTSGLYDYIDDPEIQDRLINHFDENRYDTTPAADLVAVAMKHPPAFMPAPGGATRWAYSNTNYLLAGMIAEKAGGASWEELVEHRVIRKLRLRDTSIPGADPRLPDPHVNAYLTTPDGKRLDVTEHSLQHTADSGVVSTTADLNTFFRALAGGRLLPAAQWREMRTTVERTDDPDDLAEMPVGTYGLGLREIPLSCGGFYYTHEGDGAGVNTRPAVSADGTRAVTVSLTTTTAPPDLAALNRATGTLVDHALCAAPAKGSPKD
ncbi:serine hydrolase domain-containing protein [Streptomyces sp. NPDC092369]|uniref:serine hydrolase domain-containing protein n=1 Tax=Streptomyces sp. NPDC092369 TaxID=3366015 RepID=UPI0038158CF0